MAKPTWIIESCAVADPCPGRWAEMEPVLGNASLRFCERCLRTVHACPDEASRARHLAFGRCIAVPAGDSLIDRPAGASRASGQQA